MGGPLQLCFTGRSAPTFGLIARFFVQTMSDIAVQLCVQIAVVQEIFTLILDKQGVNPKHTTAIVSVLFRVQTSSLIGQWGHLRLPFVIIRG